MRLPWRPRTRRGARDRLEWTSLRDWLWWMPRARRGVRLVTYCPLLGLRQTPALVLYTVRAQLLERAIVGGHEQLETELRACCEKTCGRRCDLAPRQLDAERRAWTRWRRDWQLARRQARVEHTRKECLKRRRREQA